MTGSFNDRGELELADGRIVFICGKKRSGKSVLATLLFDSYPGDKLVIDYAGDDGPSGPGVLELHGDVTSLPRKWPESQRHEEQPMTIRYVPNLASPTVREDVDAVVGMVLNHGRRQHHAGKEGAALLCHETDRLAPVGRVLPHMATALGQNRHYHTTLFLATQRPKGVDTKCLSNADVVYAFELMNPDDRERLGAEIGWSPREMDEAIEDLRTHEYLRYDANEMKPEPGGEDIRLLAFPALPEPTVRDVLKLKTGA